MKKLNYIKKFENYENNVNSEKEKFLKDFEDFLPSTCPIKHKIIETENGILRIAKSDGDVYFYIGNVLGEIDSEYYDNLDEDKQYDIDENLVDIICKKYNMEW
jgi:hypothetical protein